MSQLSLNIIPRLPYSPENFLIHNGVAEVFTASLSTISSHNYSIQWVQAGKRCGKTHYSVRLVNETLALHKHPKLIEGSNFEEFLANGSFKSDLEDDQVFIVDDAEEYFSRIKPGNSGEFVNFIENLRIHSGHLILISSSSVNDFECDEHITSRLKAGLINSIANPAEKDIPGLLSQMSKQRGLSLTKNRIDFVSKRIRRDIPYIENYLDRVSHLSSVLSRSVTRPLLANAL